jgi:hypothetical protein
VLPAAELVATLSRELRAAMRDELLSERTWIELAAPASPPRP